MKITCLKNVCPPLALALLLTGCADYQSNAGLDGADLRDGDPGQDGNPKNACEQLVEIVYTVIDESCQGRENSCFCDCWITNNQINDAELYQRYQICECLEAEDPGVEPCEGIMLELAEECLADVAACKQMYASILEGWID